MHTQLQRDLILGGINVAKEYLQHGDVGVASRSTDMDSGHGRAYITIALSAACLPKYCKDCELTGYPAEYFVTDLITGQKGLRFSKISVAELLSRRSFWLTCLERVKNEIVKEEVIPYPPLPENYLDLEMTWFKFGPRIINSFANQNVRILRDLLSMQNLREFHNLGKHSQMTILHTLKHYGLRLGSVPTYAIPVDMRPKTLGTSSVNLYIHTLGTNSVLGTILKCMIESNDRPANINIKYEFSLVSDIGQEISTALHFLNGYRPTITVKGIDPEAT